LGLHFLVNGRGEQKFACLPGMRTHVRNERAKVKVSGCASILKRALWEKRL
jgi:hypothetical protein